MIIVKVEKLFKRIQQEQAGKLDLLVNNAYAGVKEHLNQNWQTKKKKRRMKNMCSR